MTTPQPTTPNRVRGKMASVSVIANPLARNRDKVLVFQSGDTTYGLRVSPRSIVDFEVKTSIGPKAATSVGRKLAVPSQLVSMVYQDTVSVYGITGDDVSDLQLELLSPVQAPLDQKPQSGALAGCSRVLTTEGKDTAWLYMILNDEDEPKIAELEMSLQGTNVRFLDCKGFSKETSLYAVYDAVADTRWLIYQTLDKDLVVFDAKKDKGWAVDKSDTRVLANTPLAAAIVPTGTKEKPEQRIVLYFIGAEDKKRRILYTANALLGGKTVAFEETEEQPRAMKTNSNLKDWAGLSVYLDEPRQRVVVFGLTTKAEGQEGVFSALVHPWTELTQ